MYWYLRQDAHARKYATRGFSRMFQKSRLDRNPIPYHPCMVYLPTFTIKINHSCRSIYHFPWDPMGMTVPTSRGLWDILSQPFAQGIDSTGMLEGIRGGAECVVVLINNGWPIESKGGGCLNFGREVVKPPRARIQICPKISGFSL